MCDNVHPAVAHSANNFARLATLVVKSGGRGEEPLLLYANGNNHMTRAEGKKADLSISSTRSAGYRCGCASVGLGDFTARRRQCYFTGGNF